MQKRFLALKATEKTKETAQPQQQVVKSSKPLPQVPPKQDLPKPTPQPKISPRKELPEPMVSQPSKISPRNQYTLQRPELTQETPKLTPQQTVQPSTQPRAEQSLNQNKVEIKPSDDSLESMMAAMDSFLSTSSTKPPQPETENKSTELPPPPPPVPSKLPAIKAPVSKNIETKPKPQPKQQPKPTGPSLDQLLKEMKSKHSAITSKQQSQNTNIQQHKPEVNVQPSQQTPQKGTVQQNQDEEDIFSAHNTMLKVGEGISESRKTRGKSFLDLLRGTDSDEVGRGKMEEKELKETKVRWKQTQHVREQFFHSESPTYESLHYQYWLPKPRDQNEPYGREFARVLYDFVATDDTELTVKSNGSN